MIPTTPDPLWPALVAWYDRAGRDLPWRHTQDPYAILVSEIMLQQTQVDRVIPKYHAFLAAFPTLADLAAAPTDAIIRAWAGLGYNRRAVQLHRLAQVVVAEHGGALPDSVPALLHLPGIGRYTASAVACFAFRQRVATVDTNIRRVLLRASVGELTPVAPEMTESAAFALAESLLPPTAELAYRWNQALMDLGATICTARAPACDRCPLNAQCRTVAQMQAYTLFPSGAALRDLQRRMVAESPAPFSPRPPFETTNRYFRGRILAILRALPGNDGIPLADLGPRLKPDYAETDAPWLHRLALGLLRDGLAAWADVARTALRLP